MKPTVGQPKQQKRRRERWGSVGFVGAAQPGLELELEPGLELALELVALELALVALELELHRSDIHE